MVFGEKNGDVFGSGSSDWWGKTGGSLALVLITNYSLRVAC